jgi:putative component of membrane protein insertase Oxa1/YidC/SpoIIIJ protein YidD
MKNRKNHFNRILLFLILSIFNSIAFAQEDKLNEKNAGILSPVLFFRNTISRADGDRCPMYPSCSQYCIDAVEKHGLLWGWVMSCDRLMRCGRDEIKLSGTIYLNGEKRCCDPVTNNDFWW